MADSTPTVKKTTAKKTEKVEASVAEQLATKQADLLEAKKSHRSGELVNPRILGSLRKDIARLMTKLNAQKDPVIRQGGKEK